MKTTLFTLFCFVLLFGCALAQPVHTKLLYSDLLDDPNSQTFAEMTNRDGIFMPGRGWQAANITSQLFLKTKVDLPLEGTLVINVNKFNPVEQNASDKQHIVSMYSRPEGSKENYYVNAAWWQIRTGTAYSAGPGMAGFKFLSAPRGIDTREEARCIENKSNWRESLVYEFKVTWTIEKIYCFFDNQVVAVFDFDGQVEPFRYIFIGTDNVYQGQPGPIFSNLRLYTETAPYLLQYVSGDSQAGNVTQPLEQPFVVRLVDRSGAAKVDEEVTFTPVNGGHMSAPQPIITDGGGYAQSTFILGENAGAYEVSVSSNVTGDTTLVFHAQAEERPVTIGKNYGDNQTGRAGDVLPAPVVVLAIYQPGEPAANVPILFSVTEGNGSFAGSDSLTVITDAEGKARVNWRLGVKTGEQRLTARYKNQDLTFSATATSGPAAKIVADSSAVANFQAGKTYPFMCHVLDKFDNPVPEQAVVFNVLSGRGSLAGQSSLTVVTDLAGAAHAPWTLGLNHTWHNTLQAVVYVESDSLAVLFDIEQVQPPLLSQSTITARDSVVADGVDSTLVAIRLQNDDGLALPEYPVHIQVSGSDNLLTNSSSQTDATGLFQAVLKSSLAETKRILAAVPDVGVVPDSALVRFCTPPPQGVHLVKVSGDSQVVVAGNQPAPLVVQVVDEDNKPVPNKPVHFRIVAGEGNLGGGTSVIVTSDINGVAAVQPAVNPITQSNLLSVTAELPDGGSLVTFIIRIKPAPPQGVHLVKVAGDSQVVVAGNQPQPLVVRVVDEKDEPVAGKPVRFQIYGAQGQLGDSTAVIVNSDADGFASVSPTLRPAIQLHSFTVTAELVEEQSLLTFFIRIVPGAPIALVRLGEDSLQVDPGDSLKLAVRASDRFGNTTPSVAVTFSTEKDDIILSHQPVLTDSNGLAAATIVTGKTFGWRTLRAQITDSLVVNFALFVRQLPVHLVRMSPDTVVMALDNPQAELTVRCADVYDNPVANVPVDFRMLSGQDVSFQPVAIVSDEDGFAAVSWRPTYYEGVAIIQAKTSLDSLLLYVRFEALPDYVDARETPTDFALLDNYPNPFNPSTTIPFSLPHTTDVRLQIFNVSGQLVRTLLDAPMPAGQHVVIFNALDDNGNQLPTGTYFYRMNAGDFSAKKRLLLVK